MHVRDYEVVYREVYLAVWHGMAWCCVVQCIESRRAPKQITRKVWSTFNSELVLVPIRISDVDKQHSVPAPLVHSALDGSHLHPWFDSVLLDDSLSTLRQAVSVLCRDARSGCLYIQVALYCTAQYDYCLPVFLTNSKFAEERGGERRGDEAPYILYCDLCCSLSLRLQSWASLSSLSNSSLISLICSLAQCSAS